MASNNDTRKKQKGTAIDGDSWPSSTFVVLAPVLSLGTIVHNFPEILLYLLPCIADRTVFNSITSCNRDTHEKSKAIVPPWPKQYRLSSIFSDRPDVDCIAVWSPDGTRVAYTGHTDYVPHIVIVDQRHGIIHRISNNGAYVSELKFSPDGRFLVSVSSDDSIVNLWDNVTGHYEQLQEWNVQEDVGGSGQHFGIAISACSKYIAVNAYLLHRVILKDIENGETVRSLTPQHVMKNITKVMFSVDCRAIFVCGQVRDSLVGDSIVIKVWRPYLDDEDEDILITLWEHETCNYYAPKIIVSHDKTMIAIQDYVDRNKGWLLSIDNNYSCTVQELNVQGNDVIPVLLQFTPDDECIIYATKHGLKYWNVARRKFTDTEYLLSNKRTEYGFKVMNCSPNHRQLIFKDENIGEDNLSMKSIF